MASTYSTRLRLEKQGSGENNNTWGTILNDNVIELVDESFGFVSVTHDDTAAYSLTANNGATDEARRSIVKVGGTLTAARNLVVPDSGKAYLVHNNTAGGFAITVKTSAGTGISIPNGTKKLVYSDDVNVVDSSLITADSTDTLTNKTFDANGAGNSLSNVETADIAAGSKSGADTTLITGTAGTNGNTGQWNADGDLVDGKALPTGAIVGTTDSQSLTNKTIDGDLNTVQDLDFSSVIKTDATNANRVAGYDGSGVPTDVSISTGLDLTSGVLTATATGGLTLATPQTPTSGSTVDFTSIPSGTTQITVSFHALTANADAQLGLRIGDSGGIETTGYNGPEESNRWELSASAIGSSPWYGAAILTLVDSTNNIWSISSNIFNNADTPVGDQMGGSKALTAELDRVQVILAGSTFSSGTINIAYM